MKQTQEQRQPIHVIVCGIAGRMGQAVVASAASDPLIRVVGGVVRPGSALAGKRAGDRGPQWSAPERDFVLHTELAAALADCWQVEKRPRRAKMDPCPCSGAGVTTFRRDDRL
ncbi:MAG: hypothetical protein AAF471_08775, partial [Myxococcota bacterium]